jgi:hypothetical protein
MASWPRTNFSLPAGTALSSGTMYAVTNQFGLIELFACDYTGTIWHAAQRRAPSVGPPGHSTWAVEWPNPLWTAFPVPGTVTKPVRPAPVMLTVAKNGDGRLEVFAVGFDGNPYHMYQLPQPAHVYDPAQTLAWSGWLPMTAAPISLFEEDGFNTFAFPWSPAAATVGGMIVVCYYNSNAQGAVYYDYQVADSTQVGGVGWASVANKGLFTIALPVPQNQFFGSISLVPTSGALTLMLLSGLGGIGAQGFYASTLASAGGAWSAWQPLPPPLGASSYPTIFPKAAYPAMVSSWIGYAPGGGTALFFTDSSGALTVLRQVLTQTGGAGPLNQLGWNAIYDQQLPAGNVGQWARGVVAVEDKLADTSDPANLHQAVFFTSLNEMQLQSQTYEVPAAVPAPPGPWPSSYGPTGAPAVLDDGTGGAFTRITQLAGVLDVSGTIQVFGMTESTANLYNWSEP